MDTFYKLYNQVLLDYNWKYYNDSPSFNIKMLEDESSCKSFIKEMMKVGGKDNDYLSKSVDNLSPSRIKHIVSCFLLGFVFREDISIKDSIDKKLCVLYHDDSIDYVQEFPYIWMLICFFHDLGYNVEEGKNVASEEDGVFPLRWKTSVFLPRIYTRKAVSAYEKYREQKCMVKVDHGIYGGKVCYNELCTIRKEKEELEDSHLYWGKKLEKVYACISWTIICHNIFFVQEDKDVEQAEYYKKNGLDKFVYQAHIRKITLKSSSFLFLLCLVDTLEPLKKFDNIEVLKNISLDVNKLKIKINIECFQKIKKLKELEGYKKSVIGLGDWLCDFQIDNGVCG